MEYRVLGKTNLKISSIGLGGIPIQKCTQEEANAIIKTCVDNGINFIDSARGYGESEKLIGTAIKNHPNHFILATKSPAKTYEAMKHEIEVSLKTLDVEQIDLYQCHFVKDIEQYHLITSEKGALRALLEAKQKGLIKHIGITAHNKDVLDYALNDSVWETIQFPYNFVETQAEELFKRAYANQIGIIVMKPLAGGAIETASLAIKFVLNNPHITCAIPGMNSIQQVQENAQVASSSVLSKDEKQIIDDFVQTHQTEFCRRCGYCGPCPQGIDIPLLFTLEGYLTRYDLKDWASNRYNGLDAKADHCVQCGICEPKCPYNLPIRKMLERVKDSFNKDTNQVKHVL